MNTPEGYVSLGLVGFTDKGNYLENETYVKNDLVHEDNAIWRCLVDDCIGVNPRTDDKGHWKLWIDSENDASGITVVDKKGVLEEGEKEIDLQDFLDEIADRVMNKLLTKTGLVNNGLATEAGVAALDAAMGKTLLDKIGDTANLPNGEADIVSALVNQNSNLSDLIDGSLENMQLFSGNFNTEITPGFYVIDTNAASYTNAPATTMFGVFVQFGGDYRVQMIIQSASASTKTTIHTRRYATTSSSWTSWT